MINEFLEDAKGSMKKAIQSLESDLRAIRTGRANPALLDRIMVTYYGVPTPVKQVASVSAPEGRLLLIKPWEKKTLKNIERAILESNLGLNPNNDGKVIRLVLPQLTQERRRKLVRDVGKRAEKARVSIRNSRRDILKDLKDMQKEGDISEDELYRAQDKVQDLTNKYIKNVENMLKAKEEEITEI
ncbi:MAG: ribosome recycling factor [Ardenticatenaceae bacterium]